MNYKHYNKSELFVEPSNKNYKFRRYLTDSNKRLIQYVEGTGTQILSEDFDNVTVVPSDTFYHPVIMVLGGAVLDNSIQYIEFGNNVTQIGNNRDGIMLCPDNDTTDPAVPTHIVFPKSLSNIYGRIGAGTQSAIWDFSKLTSIPNWWINYTTDSDPRSNCFSGEIRIPSNLFSNWQSAANWNKVKDKMVAV